MKQANELKKDLKSAIKEGDCESISSILSQESLPYYKLALDQLFLTACEHSSVEVVKLLSHFLFDLGIKEVLTAASQDEENSFTNKDGDDSFNDLIERFNALINKDEDATGILSYVNQLRIQGYRCALCHDNYEVILYLETFDCVKEHKASMEPAMPYRVAIECTDQAIEQAVCRKHSPIR